MSSNLPSPAHSAYCWQYVSVCMVLSWWHSAVRASLVNHVFGHTYVLNLVYRRSGMRMKTHFMKHQIWREVM